MNPVLVLGCDGNGYGVIRSIAKFNSKLKIIGVDFNPKSPGLFSKYLSEKRIISDPNNNGENVVKELINIQNVKGQVKPYQINQFLTLVEKHNISLKE